MKPLGRRTSITAMHAGRGRKNSIGQKNAWPCWSLKLKGTKLKDDWAEEKVRVFYPACREKSTLRALAHYSDRGGYGSVCRESTVALDTGQSVRTVRRHIKALISRGDLYAWCEVDRSRASNAYYIPICTETITELEERTGISRRQMRLPFVHPVNRAVPVQNDLDRAQVLRKIGVQICPSPRAKMALPQGQNGPQPIPIPSNEHKISKKFLLEKGKDPMKYDKSLDPDATVAIAPDIEAVLAELAVKLNAPEGRVRNPRLLALSQQHQADLEKVKGEIVAPA